MTPAATVAVGGMAHTVHVQLMVVTQDGRTLPHSHYRQTGFGSLDIYPWPWPRLQLSLHFVGILKNLRRGIVIRDNDVRFSELK